MRGRRARRRAPASQAARRCVTRALRTILASILGAFAAASIAFAVEVEHPAPRHGAPSSPGHINLDFNLFLELHAELLYAARNGSSPLLDSKLYEPEIKAYTHADQTVKDFKTWQTIYDACAASADISEVKAASGRIPNDLAAGDRQAAQDLFKAFLSAWPKFEAKDIYQRKRGLMVFTTQILDRLLTLERQDRILGTLYKKMLLKPLDAPITVFIVTDEPDVGAWGKIERGYYLVIPVQNRGGPEVADALIHETTHLLERNQPRGSTTLLARLKEQSAAADPNAVDVLSHGLVAWTAGYLIRAYVKPEYVPLAESLPAWQRQLADYLPVFQGEWAQYLGATGEVAAPLKSLAATLKPKPVAAKP